MRPHIKGLDPGQHAHLIPLQKMAPWRQGMPFLHKCRVGVLQVRSIDRHDRASFHAEKTSGVLQYVAVQCLSSVLAFTMEKWEFPL